MFERKELSQLRNRIAEPRRFIQVIMGPRQIGKTTLVRQLAKLLTMPVHYVSADGIGAANSVWVEQQWETARFLLRNTGGSEGVLIIDEIQKIDDWAEVVKAQWDKDTFDERPLKLILLGSARLLLQRGLSESLAGRFETIQLTHWTLHEMETAFGLTPDQYVWFGGYPGAASLINDESRWREYVLNALIETTLSKDILMLTRVDKPALLRQLFELGCSYSGQILSYTKLLGQLQDAGNTTTLTHYTQLLDSAGLLSGLDKYTIDKARQRGSIPKWQVQNSALFSSFAPVTFEQVRSTPAEWGRWVETAVGAHLCRAARLGEVDLFYWRDGNDEVDFVIRRGRQIAGFEIKSGRSQKAPGMAAFQRKTNADKVLLVGNSGIPWEEFLRTDVKLLFD
ncbi:ATP-binding protein [Spirosoma taeanense]|uniref:ATP-binding protein n=1 Tax=Spirosoma taeanense TaxID=2735870 RepID=A0A6M5YAM6_9BACT|nr:ATP-binding protein [Spirosoma taeanense]QJW91035.1 ATP-binding protein [Spirosoma taeanense]